MDDPHLLSDWSRDLVVPQLWCIPSSERVSYRARERVNGLER